ncbi:flavohemoglobin expression-modulating QEGLA motif protein [Shinella zoogloeoides]|uniref:flavohemoglobin expression-modulating QEGLA motif protein n=1 Tax=Shinella zoogloeoides TaxID=352475 RepID=UPI00273F94DD|nr:flavohemoglobin expression-modulating QEGLA motif protein [Shinella zoogloeoides]WLR95162.1 flavohemoglobin expression-modulating QEGLA motif protein [Shinella zoogloeoides]
MTSAKAARKPRRKKEKTLAEDVIEALEAGKPVRRDFEGGRLHIDRPLPFLCLHIGDPEKHVVAREVAAANASYLLASRMEDAVALLAPIAQLLHRKFGAFLLMDVDEFDRDRLLSDDAPFLQPFEVMLSATRGAAAKRAVDAFEAAVEDFEARFRTPHVETCAAEDDPRVRPELLALRFPLLTLRFAPIYRVPGSDDMYPELRERLIDNFLDAGLRAFAAFLERDGFPKPVTYRAFGRKAFVDAVERADRGMDEVASSFDFLLAVTPINANAAWQEFKANDYGKPPRFLYRPLSLLVEREKRRLYAIVLDRLEDPVLHQIYREKQQELDLQLTLIAEREKARFVEFGRALYGPVERSLLKAASEVLEDTADARRMPSLAPDNDEVVDCFYVERRARSMMMNYHERYDGFDAAIELRDDVPAGLLVSGRRLLISRRTRMMRHRVDALLSHEVGVHLLTYFNGSAQGLRVFRTGLSGYEGMQEGLAVFAEYLAGGFTPERLRLLAARVVGCDLMLAGASFVESFRLLTREHELDAETAFGLLLRVFRGGGLAKDAIYLRGLLSLLSHLKAGGALDPFWMGKISAAHFSVMEELGARGLLKPPILRPLCLETERGRARLERARTGLSPLAMLQA